MRPLKALISKSTMNRAHASFSIEGFIKNPKYEDAIKYGNVILIKDEWIKLYIVSDRESLPKEFQKRISEEYDIVFIKYDPGKYGYTYWNATSFEKKFPYHKHWSDVKIEKVWISNVDLKTIKSKKDFEALYDEICSKIK